MPSRAETTDLGAEVRTALAHLLKARAYAADVQCDPWEFAVEIDRLTSLGLTGSDLRWLQKKGYVDHGYEVTRPGDAARKFVRSRNLAFTKKSCFFLAESALLSSESMTASIELPCLSLKSCEEMTTDSAPSLTKPGRPTPSKANAPISSQPLSVAGSDSLVNPAPQPCWDTDDRTLYVGRQIVKEYRVRSPNQEAILSAFQEEGWPRSVDDPLSPTGDLDPKIRLRDTIKCLNANQRNPLIRFRGNGTGERVRWEMIEPQALPIAAVAQVSRRAA